MWPEKSLGVSGNLSQTNMSPGTEAFYSLLIYTKHLFSLILQIGLEVFPLIQGKNRPFSLSLIFKWHMLVWHVDQGLHSVFTSSKLTWGSLRWKVKVEKIKIKSMWPSFITAWFHSIKPLLVIFNFSSSLLAKQTNKCLGWTTSFDRFLKYLWGLIVQPWILYKNIWPYFIQFTFLL